MPQARPRTIVPDRFGCSPGTRLHSRKSSTDGFAWRRHDWGFDLTENRVPMRVVYGLTDVLVPWQHGAWLGRNVPNAEVVIEEESGHLPDPAMITERFGWLVRPS